MANTRNITKNKLTIEAKNMRKKKRRVILAIGAIFALIAGFYLHLYAGVAVTIIAFLIALSRRKCAIITSGAKGEDIAVKLLKKLPDSFHLLNQVDIPNKESSTGYNEADLIIVGDQAVFVIEVKHNKGRIDLDEQARDWSVVKTGRGGTDYTKTMRNPIAQVNKLIWLLSNHMKQKKVRSWIQGVILFTHDDIKLIRRADTSVPVLQKHEVIDYITQYQNSHKEFNKENVVKVIAGLK